MRVPQNMVSLIAQPDAVYIDNTFRRNSFVRFHDVIYCCNNDLQRTS